MAIIPVVSLIQNWWIVRITVITKVITLSDKDVSGMGSYNGSFEIMVVDGLMDRNLLHRNLSNVVVYRVVVERWAYLEGMSVVICTLLRNIVFLGPRHGEVKWVVSLILVVIGVIFVAMSVLTGHVMVFGVHVVV